MCGVVNQRNGLGSSALRLAEGIAAMIDGLWLRYALTGKPEDAETPRALTRDYLAAALVQASYSDKSTLRRLRSSPV